MSMGKEKYKSKSAMRKHEMTESKKERMMEYGPKGAAKKVAAKKAMAKKVAKKRGK